MASKQSRSFQMDTDKMMLTKPQQLQLKDYLLDDLSSCSSSGFRSFPRRQCCITTVRFPLEKDLKSNQPSVHNTRQKKTAASSAISAFQKASEALILNAAKLLSVYNRNSVKSGFLARRVFKRAAFWKKNLREHGQLKNSEIHRWKTSHNLISVFPDTPTRCIVPTPPIAATTATTTTTADSTSTGDRNSKSSRSWPDDEFSSECLQSTAHDAESAADAAAKCWVDPVDKPEEWMAKDDDKEQFSPVSVLDSPFLAEEGDDESSPVSDTELVQMEETNKRQTHRRLESTRNDLERRLAEAAALSENEPTKDDPINSNAEKAQRMLHFVKTRTQHASSETLFPDNLLLDFFLESNFPNRSECQLIEAVENYLAGDREGKQKMEFDWAVEEVREWYLKDMKWKHVDDQRAEFVMEIEVGIWWCLVNELMSELPYCTRRSYY